MRLIVDDFKKILPEILKSVDLAGGSGEEWPTINNNLVLFNGRAKCGHPEDYLGVAWPSDNASGIANPFKEDAVDGNWFGGVTLNKRVCDGDCSHEAFYFPRIMKVPDSQKPDDGLYFEFSKTAYKPYDLAVIVFLIIAKHYLKDRLVVNSDGTDSQWLDGKLMCQDKLSYGTDFGFIEGQLSKKV
jgi:hypothetical protein